MLSRSGTSLFQNSWLAIVHNLKFTSCLLNSVGPLCELMETATSGIIRQTCDTYDNYISSLNLMCVSGAPGTLVWTPDENTPDLVYYQVNTDAQCT